MPFSGRITCEPLQEKKMVDQGICYSTGDCEGYCCFNGLYVTKVLFEVKEVKSDNANMIESCKQLFR